MVVANDSSKRMEMQDVAHNASDEDDHFGFTSKSMLSNSPHYLSIDMQAFASLKEKDRNIQSLNKHPLIKTLFLKCNRTVPYSAPVEKLFPFTGSKFLPRKSMLSNRTFERLLLKTDT